MNEQTKILNPPTSDEAEDQTAYAVQAIREAVAIIHEHYTDRTRWPGWTEDAAIAVRSASELLMMSAAEGTL